MQTVDAKRFRYWLVLEALLLTLPAILAAMVGTYLFVIQGLLAGRAPLAFHVLLVSLGVLPQVLVWMCVIDVARRRRIRRAVFLLGAVLGLAGTIPLFDTPHVGIEIIIPTLCWALVAHLLYLDRQRRTTPASGSAKVSGKI